MNKREARPLAAALLILAAGLSATGLSHAGDESSALSAARRYLEAVAALDLPAARSLAVGEAAARLGSLNGGEGFYPSWIRAEALSTREEGHWARVHGRVETVSTSGIADLHWLDLQLVYTGGGWRVYRMRPAVPGTPAPGTAGSGGGQGRGGRLGGREGRLGGRAPGGRIPADALSILEDFLHALVQDPGALQPYLAGPALRAWQVRQPLLGPGRLYTRIEGALWDAVSIGNDLIRVRGSYRVDGRKAQALFTLARLGDGWKIVEVAALGPV